jgi:hypothetical protein
MGQVIANVNNIAMAMPYSTLSITSTGISGTQLGLPPYSENPVISSTYGLTIS